MAYIAQTVPLSQIHDTAYANIPRRIRDRKDNYEFAALRDSPESFSKNALYKLVEAHANPDMDW